MVRPLHSPEQPLRLTELATRVRLARQLVNARRMSPVAQADLSIARASLLQAIEAYVAELRLLGMPVPPRLRDELRLLRRLPS